MRLSVCIVNWNTTGLLGALLESISRYAPLFEYEVIVVDNASSDFDEPAFRAHFGWVKLIRNEGNAGYAKGCNQAIEASTGDYILLLNPDTEVTDGALAAFVEFMDSHPDAAAAGGKLVRPDGTVDRSLRSFPCPGPIACEFLGLSRVFPKSRTFGAYRMTYFGYDRAAEVDQPMGSCLLLRSQVVRKVGLFDEAFPIFFNEVDWLYRAKQKGYGAYFTPDAVFVHHGAASTGQVARREMVRESHESLIRFYRKHFRGRVCGPVYYFTLACIYFGKFIRS